MVFVQIGSHNTSTGYDYGFDFVFEHPYGPLIRINTEPRSTFLAKGNEESSQKALEDLAKKTRLKSGGFFDIHPFYGAVWGTKLTPAAPEFLTDLGQLEDTLTAIIWLTDTGNQFDLRLTQMSQEIGTVVAIPGPNSNKLLEYMQAEKINPNQPSRDQAIANSLGERWDEENRRFNQTRGIPRTMNLNPKNIANLMEYLKREANLTNLNIVVRTFEQPLSGFISSPDDTSTWE